MKTAHEKLAAEIKRFKKDPRIKHLNERIGFEYSKNMDELERIYDHNRTWYCREYMPPFTNPVIEDAKRRYQHILKHQYYLIFNYKQVLGK
jgi:hypothetical protein